ncbi:MAG TPA: ABC transporter permease [Candidatus Barnesiella excrementigallinarum]|nr:ABC transporter permease [Candidatus Barnesiella excrementigallinarum]
MNNWKLYIANRIHFDKHNRKKATPPAIRVAVAGVALGLAVMILSVAIVIGFKQEIRNKVVGFGAHIQITSFDNNMTYEKQPIQYTDSLHDVLAAHDGIKQIDPVGTKLGMIKTDSDFMGVALKGVPVGYNWSFFDKYLVDGALPALSDSATSNEVLVSKFIADKLNLHIGDKIYCYFVQDQVRARRFTISGIYQTDFLDYDKLLIIGDVRHVQRLNNWNADQYSEIELLVNDFDQTDDIAYDLYVQLIDRPDDYGTHYYPQSIRTLNPIFFGWLDLLDMNVWIILILMAAVSGFTMISGLLIIILERANMIGVLKALGANNTSIRQIFLYVSTFLVGKGMIWGNIIGITLCLLQQQFHIIKLNPEAYYVPYVPIEINPWYILWLNVGCMVVSVLMLIVPSYLVALIRPAKSIKFE